MVAMDAPFWLPKGNWRPSEDALMKRGFRPLSSAFPSMRMLTMRAMHIVRVLRERGYRVIEVFPRASEQILGLSKEPRKNQDEYDALLAALTGKAFLEGKYEDLSGIVIPK
jgi:predicted nuclease with RNAse H fold